MVEDVSSSVVPPRWLLVRVWLTTKDFPQTGQTDIFGYYCGGRGNHERERTKTKRERERKMLLNRNFQKRENSVPVEWLHTHIATRAVIFPSCTVMFHVFGAMTMFKTML